jgi:hypothetical protein
MTISKELDQIYEEKEQRIFALEARDILKSGTTALKDCNTAIQVFINEGTFDTLPNDLKGALNRWRLLLLGCQEDIQADSEIVECFTWDKPT